MIGITTTIPVEVIYGAGHRAVDLNNLFIGAPDPDVLVEEAERAGFPHNTCAWIKGMYGAVFRHEIPKIVAVTGGDCSNTVALAEVLARRGVEVIPFEYPLDGNEAFLKGQVERLMKAFSAAPGKVMEAKERLDRIREKLCTVDELTYMEGRVTGLENHRFLVASSDFEGDPKGFETRIDRFLEEARRRPSSPPRVRLGFLGVPCIFQGLYEFIESLGARVVFNEVQRQFSMPYGERDLVRQYLRYTYPYRLEVRIADIREQIQRRRLHGLIHYTQTFCHRQIYDMLLRESLSLPVLTLEGDRPGPLDGRTANRIETFVEMLGDTGAP